MTSQSSANVDEKSKIRRKMRLLRGNFSEQKRLTLARQLAEQLDRWPAFAYAQRIATYLAQDNELSLSVLIDRCLEQQKQLYLPVLRPLPPNRLWFAPFDKKSKLTPNRFGIDEPDVLPNQNLRASVLDVVCFPLVAFDPFGGRLGMGGGFYDRTFEHLANADKRPLFVGIAYQEQQVEQLPIESWDIPLDAVATPEKIWQFGN